MDFIFDEESDDVGSDIEAYCPKCKGDTAHTIITKYEDEIRRVQCSPCGDVHSFRKPRGEVEDDIPEPVAAKKRAAAKKPTWEEARARVSEKTLGNARPYSIRETYRDGDLVAHPKFGVGFVTEIAENKVEVTFQDERRVLIHNRPDLAAQMPSIAALPTREPRGKSRRDAGKKKAPRGAASVEPPTEVPSKGAVAKVPAMPAPALVPKAALRPVAVATTKPRISSKPARPVAKPTGKVATAASKAARARAVAIKKQVKKQAAHGKAARPAKKPTSHRAARAPSRASRAARAKQPPRSPKLTVKKRR